MKSSGCISLANQQRRRRIPRERLQRQLQAFLEDHLPGLKPPKGCNRCLFRGFEISVRLVGEKEMARLNEKWLGHAGATDVITFSYTAPGSGMLRGDLFVCVDEAVAQAPRFGVDWRMELVRYILHGILHLAGYDDHRAADRAKMKEIENRWARGFLKGGPAARAGAGLRRRRARKSLF